MKTFSLLLFSLVLLGCNHPNIYSHNKINKTVSTTLDKKITDDQIINNASIVIKIKLNDSIIIKPAHYGHNNVDHHNYTFIRNGKTIYIEKQYSFINGSKYNRLIKNSQGILLFLENDGRPNYNTIVAYSISNDKVTFLADCVYNDNTQGDGPVPFTDIDNDGFLEYGGFDINEAPQNQDSIYYNPSKFYEIKNGKLLFDRLLTRSMDIKTNGVYLSKFLDKSGNCCLILKKPK